MNVFLGEANRFVLLHMLDEASTQHGLTNLGYNFIANHEPIISENW
jgi:hypothetical protein